MTRGRHNVPPPRTDKTSVLVRGILDELSGDQVTVGEIVDRLRRRSFGGLMLLLAALGLLPGLSVFAGLAMLIPGAQMAIGLSRPALPGFLRRRRVGVATLRSVGESALPWIERVERYIRPRWFRMTLPPMPHVFGVFVVLLSLVFLLPLPFSNLPPAVALIGLALGLLERDGLVVLIALALGVVALTVGGLVAYVAVEALMLFLDAHFGG